MAFIVKRETTQPRSLIVKRDAIFKIFRDFWSNTLGNFWNLTSNPYNKKISNFNVTYAGGQVDINWGEGIDPNIPSNTNIDHTFGITTEGISIFPKNGANITYINCGTSSPPLGGTIGISGFPNLQEFICNYNNITAVTGYTQNSNMKIIDFSDNLVTGSIPNLNALSSTLENFICHRNRLSGPIPSLSNFSNLKNFSCFNQAPNGLTGPIPSLNGLTNLINFTCHTNLLSGPIPSLAGLTNLEDFTCDRNQLTGFIPSLNGLSSLKIFNCRNNLLRGSIPSLNGLNNLQLFHCWNQFGVQKLTGFNGGPISNTLGDFQAQNNQLTSGSVNEILAAFVAAARTTGTPVASGTCILNLGGAGNFRPVGQGITDVTTLRNRGWTVTTGVL